MSTDYSADSYNKYDQLPLLSYNCISYMLDNNELIWKLLKFNTADAWDQDDLTRVEKSALIYAGQSNQNDFRVFMDVGADDAVKEEMCILRITPIELSPTNHIIGKVTMGFECYCHYGINHLSNYSTRLNTIAQQIIEVFNGKEVGGLGKLYFDARASSRCKMRTIGTIPWKGVGITMCNWLT